MKKPIFSSPILRPADLNAVADAAFSGITVDGAEIVNNPLGSHINVPRPNDRIWARVYLEEGYLSSAFPSVGFGGSTTCGANKHRYSFVQQKKQDCAEFEDMEYGITGDGVYNVAFEQNNVLVDDGSVQRLDFFRARLDTTVTPARQIIEWIFNAGGGGGDGPGQDSTGFCFQGPPGIYISSQQICCDEEHGMSANFWYDIYNRETGCIERFDSLTADLEGVVKPRALEVTGSDEIFGSCLSN